MHWSIMHAVHVACMFVLMASFDLFTGGSGYVGDDNPAAGGFFLKRAIVALNGFFLVRQQPNDASTLARVWPSALDPACPILTGCAVSVQVLGIIMAAVASGTASAPSRPPVLLS
jgi:hypothetical protein